MLKEQKKTTITNASGNFSITATGKNVLQFSFIGFVPLEVAVNDKNNLSVTLKADTKELDAIVVTALGIKREAKKLG